MKKIFSRLEALRDKAAQFQQVVDTAPARVAQLREVVNATTGHLQQLRSEVQTSVSALRADHPSQMAEALVELDSSLEIFARAGCDLTGVDLEPGPPARLIVRLERIEALAAAPLRALIAEIPNRKTTQAILAALLSAQDVENSIRLTELVFQELVVHVGPVPSVRLGWRRPHEPEPARAVPSESRVPPTAAPSTFAGYGAGSFFERSSSRSDVASIDTAAVVPAAVALPQNVGSAQTESSGPLPSETSTDWRKDALARFKKMPNLSKSR